MARGCFRFDAASRAAATVALLGVALLGPLACGSGSDAGDDDAAVPSAAPSRVPPRDERAGATDAEPSAGDAEGDDSPAASPAPSASAGAPDEPAAAPGTGSSGTSSLPQPDRAAFAACMRSEGSYGTNCDSIYVTMTQATAERCAQLTIDNCGDSYTRQGLPVDTPRSWQLSSASIGASPDDCELGVFNPESTIVVGASGEIRWELSETPRALPTDMFIEVTLQPSSAAEDPSSVDVVTTEPLNPVRCDD
jgi:hypothetical protein